MFTSKIDKSSADESKGDFYGSAHGDQKATSLDRVVIRGFFRLTEDGALQIGGEVEGDIKCHAMTILEGGSMAGNVQAERLIVEGAFDGNIESEHLVVARSAQVVSDDVLVHDSVVIEPEAHFEGILRRPGKSAKAAAKPPQASPEKPAPAKPAAGRKGQPPAKQGSS